MNLGKLFKYGFLATLSIGNMVAMETTSKEEKLANYGQAFANVPPDVSSYIVQLLPMPARLSLAGTCQSWKQLIQQFLKTPFQHFDQININLNLEFFGELSTFDCLSDSFYIFLPFQEKDEKEKTTEWQQTTPWCISGHTMKVERLATFNGAINSCAGIYHPDGIVLFDWKTFKHPNLLKIQDGIIQLQPIFQDIEEAQDTNQGLTFACSKLKSAFISNNILSCYDLKQKGAKKLTVTLESTNLRTFNFQDKFLVHGNYPEKLWLINPELEGLNKKEITLPAEFNLYDLTSDKDSLLVSGGISGQYDQPRSHFLIENISSDQPVITPLSFLPEGYNSIGFCLKNNYVFSIGSEISNPENNKANEKSGVFVIYDLVNQHKCFQKFIPALPIFMNFVGTTLFIETTRAWEVNNDYDSENSYDSPYIDKDYSLMGINIKNWL